MPFDFVGRRSGSPGRKLRVIGSDQRVRKHGRKGYARVEQAKISRMRDLHLPAANNLFTTRCNIFQRNRAAKIIPACKMLSNLFRIDARPNLPLIDEGLRSFKFVPDWVNEHGYV